MSQPSYPNLDAWRDYCKHYPSPNTYVDASWLFIVAAALQRRVWMNSGKVVFPNQYVWFIAEPGVGKDIVKDVRETLMFYDRNGKPSSKSTEERIDYMYPVSATSTSREKFMDVLARRPQFVSKVSPPYVHSSAAFILSELTSVFKQQAGEMMTFLLEGWDCVERYTDDKIGAGERYIKNMCVNIIGGTQPDTFTDIKSAKVIGSGFLRRSIMIYEQTSRQRMFLIPPHTENQLKSRLKFLQHVLKLSSLYGPVRLSDEALVFAQEWFKDEAAWTTNKSPYLKDYYQSKQVHVMKYAMAYHFSENLTMEIGIESVKAAIEFLRIVERNMHMPFTPVARTDAAEVKGNLIRRLELETHPIEIKHLYPPFMRKLNLTDFLAVVADLEYAGTTVTDKDGKIRLNK